MGNARDNDLNDYLGSPSNSPANLKICNFFSKLTFQKLEKEKKRKDMQIRVWVTKISNRNRPAKIAKL